MINIFRKKPAADTSRVERSLYSENLWVCDVLTAADKIAQALGQSSEEILLKMPEMKKWKGLVVMERGDRFMTINPRKKGSANFSWYYTIDLSSGEVEDWNEVVRRARDGIDGVLEEKHMAWSSDI